MAAEKKWIAKQVGYGKKICKILSKVKSAKDADNAAKKIDAVHLTSSGEPKSPRPKMPEGVTSEDLPLKNIMVDEETGFRTHLPKKLLSNYNDIMNEIEYTMADMEESSPKLETSVQKYMKYSAPFIE